MKFYSALHLLLLAYIIAALSFWWLSLEKQSRIIYDKEMITANEHYAQDTDNLKYTELTKQIELRKTKRSKQYLGEGLTFLFVILVGSSIVYTTYRFHNKLSRQQNNFMLSVTHELKSPIAAMKLTLQTLQKHQLDEEKQKQLLLRCIIESDRLNELCNNILIASQMEGGQYQNEWQSISVSKVVLNAFESYQSRYSGRFIAEIAPDIHAETDKMLLQLAINNVLENAVKYTPADKSVIIELQEQNSRCILSVRDFGSGIPDNEKKKIFDQFYRIGDENTRKTKGTGLGLYLSKKIMKSLGGTITVKDNQPNGSVFELSIPSKSV